MDLMYFTLTSLFTLTQVKDTHVLVATGQTNMLERLQESNVYLEDIQKGLNTYLEMKRLYFPRFYYHYKQLYD